MPEMMFEQDRERLLAISNRWKRHMPFAGLSFFTRMNTPRAFVLAARHYPHRLTWDWALYYRAALRFRFFWSHRRPHEWVLFIPLIGELNWICRKNEYWMMNPQFRLTWDQAVEAIDGPDREMYTGPMLIAGTEKK